MSWINKIGWSSTPVTPKAELPNIFPCPIAKKDFVNIDIETMFSRILVDVLEKTHGIPEEKQALLWDNCLASESSDGLVTMIARSMREMNELFLVYDKSVNVIRKALSDEIAAIKADYEKIGQSKVGVYISFKNYKRAKMIEVYSTLEYHSIAALFKSMNLASAIQFKVESLRASVGQLDSEIVVDQAKAVAQSLKNGNDVMIDSKDIIDSSSPDLTATNSATELVARKLSFYLGLPASYILGLISNSMSDTGVADSKAVERGLKNYFYSIIKPVLDALFGIKVTFKTEDYVGITAALEALKTFELTSNEFLSAETKLKIINSMLGLPENTKGDAPEPPPIRQAPPMIAPAEE